jgi:hypothetical protein
MSVHVEEIIRRKHAEVRARSEEDREEGWFQREDVVDPFPWYVCAGVIRGLIVVISLPQLRHTVLTIILFIVRPIVLFSHRDT